MNKILPSTVQLLRFHFSFFLMPVFWFALSQVESIEPVKASLIFILLHLLVYPASNGFNSYMDRDTTPIGGVKNPMLPQKQLLYVTWILNLLAIAISLLISLVFTAGITLYILASLAYSSRKVRLKKYPVIGFLTVVIFQGALTFFLVYHGSSISDLKIVPVLPMIAASLLIGGFYPLTQIYQHEADKKDGVITISYLLGYLGTFVFTGIIYAFAFLFLGYIYYQQADIKSFIILQLFMVPVFIYYAVWFYKVWRNNSEADFKNTMRMNILASVCTNLGFMTILIIRIF
ncbi:MAG: UbiA family prenyltransferase [Ginsengibacter sp.]